MNKDFGQDSRSSDGTKMHVRLLPGDQVVSCLSCSARDLHSWVSRRSFLRARIWASGDPDPRAAVTRITSGLARELLRLLPASPGLGLDSGRRPFAGGRGGVVKLSSLTETDCIRRSTQR